MFRFPGRGARACGARYAAGSASISRRIRMNTHTPFDMDAVAAIVAQRKAMPGAMLPILHGIQEKIGYIPSAGGAADRAGTQRLARRGAWRHYLLPPFPANAAGPACAADLPCRSLPGDGWKCFGRACNSGAWMRLSRNDRGSRLHPGTGVLPGTMRMRPGDHDRRRSACARFT